MKIIEKIKSYNFLYSLRTQLILYYTVFSLIVLAAGSVFSYSYIMDILKNQNEKYMLQQFGQSGYNIRSLINDVDRISKLFVSTEDFQELLQKSYNSDYENIQNQKAIFRKISDYTSNFQYIKSIYIFTQEGDIMGGNSKSSRLFKAAEMKGAPCLLRMKKAAESKFPNYVLGGSKQEVFNPDLPDASKNVLSVAWKIKASADFSREALLIINIDERYISSIYSGSLNLRDGYMYIVDDLGKIISSKDGKEIGNKSAVTSQIQVNGNYGSFTSRGSNGKVQTIYYRIENTNWYLIGEIPFRIFSKDISALQRIVIIVFTSSFIVIFIISFLWMRKITAPLNILAGRMKNIGKGELGLTVKKVPKNELGIVIREFNKMSINIADLIKRNEQIQEQKRELEIEALQAQINPHFIYNTLNMIKWMAAVIKAKNIFESVVALSNILRPVFKNADSICTLKDEMELVQNYLKIMNWRFGNNIIFDVNIQENLMDCLVPKFIIQPVIENSITHGMKSLEEFIHVRIDIVETNNDMDIKISDTGKGIMPEMLEEINRNLDAMVKNTEGSIGLYNVNRRIRLNYGNNYGVKIEGAEDQGTVVCIHVPVIKNK